MKKACAEISLEENIGLSNEDDAKNNINGRITSKTIVQQSQSENGLEVQCTKSRDFCDESGQKAQIQNSLEKVRSVFFESYFVF